MAEVRFYHLTTQTQEQALPQLLTKAYERGMKVLVRLRDDAQVEHMNEVLWTFSAESFLPHGAKKDGKPHLQPIWLTAQDENPNGATVLFTGSGVNDCELTGFDLRCELLDGRDSEALSAARARWKQYKEQALGVTYWQQNERGGWEQKA